LKLGVQKNFKKDVRLTDTAVIHEAEGKNPVASPAL
jgi:hypothetical protein